MDKKITKIKYTSRIDGFNTLTFKSAYDMWVRHYKVNTKNKETTLKAYLTKRKILDFDVLISKLNLPYLQNCFNKLIDYQYSNQTNRDVLSIFKKVMTYIKINYGVSFPYLNDLSVPNRALTFDEINSKKNNYLEQDQLKKFLMNFM